MNTLKLLAGAAAALAMSLSAAAAETTLKLAHAAPETDLQQAMSLFFKEQVEARSNGSVKVNIFPSGQLGNDAQMIDGTRAGIIDISMVGLNNYSGLMPESAAFTLPFMFPTRDAAYRVLDGDVGQGVLADMAQFGLKGLGFPENGYRNMTNNRGPIKAPADVAGLQMRVNNSKALNDMFAELSANPQQIPVAELYTALETGVVDAQDHPIGVTLSFKFYEVQKYLSMTRHAYSPLALTMNHKAFEGLSDDEQKIVLDVAKEAVDLQRKLSIEKEDGMIADLEAAGMTVNDDVDGAAFQAAITPVWDSFVAQHGDGLIKAILAASK
ncbi:TRAP dicarboxylate transporter, DctP subunit (plasmid) [Ruegeria pomeroyi DSS-3]|uniref:TRAP dicarboxylate transporter, DctP subunit n=2 Tax=Ruegeria pomeroyi TaxID=89184 RepID=Q5LKY0_RUEPO|nr:DctP family TRAP transporter solute-binding subunit [Ruegeria pomeroyi]AAV97383.1 TRAP dicarboxylate transporter, DctP subunit [Ruegeria pomeroyi DSS-3]NVK97040.1 DctP family TRAP transporter solute-binding subunit [Ruegeria pomeroyi]HCE71659.1 C4-dicarboxylate ABC transporter substrate-binding protein [Ruegeria sp.]